MAAIDRYDGVRGEVCPVIELGSSEPSRDSESPVHEAETAWWARPAVIVAVAALIRFAALFLIEGEVNDGTTRIGTAANWFFAGVPTFGRTVWGEGNYVLPGLALLVWNDPYWSVRILYALIALTNVSLAYTVTAEAFDRRTAAVAGWIVALMPFHIFVSANAATSEGPYISLVLASLWAVMRYRRAPALRWAVLAGLALALATTFRFDGVIWGIPLAASFVLLYPGETRTAHLERRTVLHLAVFGVCGLLYVVAIFWRWSVLYDSPWYPLDQAKLNTLQFFSGGQHPRWPNWLYQTYVVLFWPASTFLILTPVVAAASWVGLVDTVRLGRRSALPLVLGILVASVWLAYATFTHAILAQFRYALILATALAAFVLPGVQVLRRRLPRDRGAAVAVGALLIGVACQALITDASLHERGVLTNQLRSISPIQRSQFAARDLLVWAETHATPDAPLVVTPHVQSAYFSLKSGPLTQAHRAYTQVYYLPNSQLVYTRPLLEDSLAFHIARARWVATSAGSRQIGLRGGLASEVVQPVRTGATYQWHGIELAPVAAWGDIRVWEVARRESARPDPVRGARCTVADTSLKSCRCYRGTAPPPARSDCTTRPA